MFSCLTEQRMGSGTSFNDNLYVRCVLIKSNQFLNAQRNHKCRRSDNVLHLFFLVFVGCHLACEIPDKTLCRERLIKISREIVILLLCEFAICAKIISLPDKYLSQMNSYEWITLFLYYIVCLIFSLKMFPILNRLRHSTWIHHSIYRVSKNGFVDFF